MMQNITIIAFLLISIGVAAQNLFLSALSGAGFSVLHNHKWIVILVLFFIIQNELIDISNSTAISITPFFNGRQQQTAIFILAIIGARIVQQLFFLRKRINCFQFTPKDFLEFGFSASLQVFSFGFAANWLEVSEWRRSIVLFILISLIGGLLIGRFHYQKLLIVIYVLCASLFLTGLVILLIKQFNL